MLSLAINARPNDAYAAALPDVAAGQYIVVSVTDTGSGMAADGVARLRPVLHHQPIGQGNSLGPSMIYGFVKQPVGQVRYSEVGRAEMPPPGWATARLRPGEVPVLQSAQRIDLVITDVGPPGSLNSRQLADVARVLRRPGCECCSSRVTPRPRRWVTAARSWHAGHDQAIRHGGTGDQDAGDDRGGPAAIG